MSDYNWKFDRQYHPSKIGRAPSMAAAPEQPSPRTGNNPKTTRARPVMLGRYIRESSFDEPAIYGRCGINPSSSLKPAPFGRGVSTNTAKTSKKLAEFEELFNKGA